MSVKNNFKKIKFLFILLLFCCKSVFLFAQEPTSTQSNNESNSLTINEEPSESLIESGAENEWFLSGYKFMLSATATAVIIKYDAALSADEIAEDDTISSFRDPNTGTSTSYIKFKGGARFGSEDIADDPRISWKLSLFGKDNFFGNSGFGYQAVYETFEVRSNVENYKPYGSDEYIDVNRGTTAEAKGIVFNPMLFYAIGDTNSNFFGKIGLGAGVGFLDASLDHVTVEKYTCHSDPTRSYDFKINSENDQYCSSDAEVTEHIEQTGFSIAYSALVQLQLFNFYASYEYSTVRLDSDGQIRFSTKEGVPFMEMSHNRVVIGYQIEL
jgi:hypothetical protein